MALRKGLFTKKGRKELQKRRSSSESYPTSDEISNTWSTDPRDLPKGHSVGSMSVPYPPPYYKAAEAESVVLVPKDSKGKKKRPKSVHQSSSKNELAPAKKFWQRHRRNVSDTPSFEYIPIVNQPVMSPVPDQLNSPDHPLAAAFMANTQEMSPERSGDSLPPNKPPRARVKGSPEPRREKVKDEPTPSNKLVDMRRSCSLDALDTIGEPKPRTHFERRNSFEGDSPVLARPNYNRVTSYHTPPTRAAVSLNSKSRLYKRPPKGSESPTFKKDTTPQNSLQRFLSRPRSVDNLYELIQTGVDVNSLDENTGDAVIHTILKDKRKHKLEVLLALLVNSDVNVNLANKRGNTALHIAIEEGDAMCVRALVVFGADINKPGSNEFTPIDICINNGHMSEIESMFMELGAKGSAQMMKQEHTVKVPRMHSFAENMTTLQPRRSLKLNDRLSDFINKQGMRRFYQELKGSCDRRLSLSASDEGGMYEAYALVQQQKELARYNKTLHHGSANHNTSFALEGGSRVLFLDGGGIKGLIQLEVLSQIEERTGRSITELFDWIVGTSTGGVIALGLVYGKQTLKQLRQLYFKLKDRIFAKARYGYGYDSEALDDILQEYLDPDIKMTDVSHPKVLIAAVNKATTNLKLDFFNNCFGDEYCDIPVWKVARYTSAAPMFFTEMDNYVDGGVICNNPTEYGLTRIQTFFRQQGMKLPISVVVSIGSGSFPSEVIGEVNAQEALYFGKHWFNPGKMIKKTQNLLSLLTTALVESEMVATNSKSRCEEQNIPFFRFSPRLNEIIPAGETDNDKLFSMVLQTKTEIINQRMTDLIELFHKIAEASHAPIFDSIPEESPDEEVLDNAAVTPPAVVVIGPNERGVGEIPSLDLYEDVFPPPQVTSSPNLNAERINLNLSQAIKQDPSIEHSISALSDIQEESFHQSQSLSFSQGSTVVLDATPPVHHQQALQPASYEQELTELNKGSGETEQEPMESPQIRHQNPLEHELSLSADYGQLESEEEGITSSLSTQKFESSTSTLGDTPIIEDTQLVIIDQQGNSRQETNVEPNPSNSDSTEPSPVISSDPPPLTSSELHDIPSIVEPAEQDDLLDDEQADNSEPADFVDSIPTNSDDQQVKPADEDGVGSPDFVTSHELPNKPFAKPCCEGEEISSSSEEDLLAESQGFQLYTRQLERELDTCLSTTEKVRSTKTQATESAPPPNETLINKETTVQPEVNGPINEQPIPTEIDATGESSETESDPPSTASDVIIPVIVEPEPTSSPGRDTPPGPLEQSQTTIAFNLIEQQYSHVFEELSSIKANQTPHYSSEELSTTPNEIIPQEDTSEPEIQLIFNGTTKSPILEPMTPPPDSPLSDTPTPQASPEPIPASHEESSPEPHEAIHPSVVIKEERAPLEDFTTPNGNGPRSYIVDRVAQLGEGERDFLLSYQTFQKQYRVEDDPTCPTKSNVPKNKKSKTAHFKLQTKTSSKGSRETSI